MPLIKLCFSSGHKPCGSKSQRHTVTKLTCVRRDINCITYNFCQQNKPFQGCDSHYQCYDVNRGNKADSRKIPVCRNKYQIYAPKYSTCIDVSASSVIAGIIL